MSKTYYKKRYDTKEMKSFILEALYYKGVDKGVRYTFMYVTQDLHIVPLTDLILEEIK